MAARPERRNNRHLIHEHPVDADEAWHQLVLFNGFIRANTLATLVRRCPTALIESFATARDVRLTITVSPQHRGAR